MYIYIWLVEINFSLCVSKWCSNQTSKKRSMIIYAESVPPNQLCALSIYVLDYKGHIQDF